ncbi:MAG: SufE family protein [Terricaulis sp.]
MRPASFSFAAISDAHLVRGLIALLMRVYSGRTPAEILSVEPRALFDRLGPQGRTHAPSARTASSP